MAAPRVEARGREEAPHPESPWWGMHVARYQYAVRTLRYRRILDIACGTGYGMSILTTDGQCAVGVDFDHESLELARHSGPVVRADALALPFREGVFDAVTSFETIEHLQQRPAFAAELERVMSPGAVLLLSTPNALYTEPVEGRPRNPFHVFEYTPDELLNELTTQFRDIRLVGQQLNPRFRIGPFPDDHRRLPRTPRARFRLTLWRVINKLPPRLRDLTSNAIWHHPLYPSEDDYVFEEAAVTTGAVLVAEARKSSDTRR